MLMTWSRMR